MTLRIREYPKTRILIHFQAKSHSATKFIAKEAGCGIRFTIVILPCT